MLDELVAVAGYHRKHAIRVLAKLRQDPKRGRRRAARVYGPTVKDALIVLWEASDRICGKRLKPLIPILLPALDRHELLQIADVDRLLILKVSGNNRSLAW